MKLGPREGLPDLDQLIGRSAQGQPDLLGPEEIAMDRVFDIGAGSPVQVLGAIDDATSAPTGPPFGGGGLGCGRQTRFETPGSLP